MTELKTTQRKRRLSRGGSTIHDVAAKAEVSPMTVSRVINNGGYVSEALRARVEAAIRELNFAPNPAARRLAAVKGATIALLYDNPSRGFMGELLIGALDEGASAGAQILVQKHQGDEPMAPILSRLARAGVEGVILVPPLSDTAGVVEEIAAAGLAVVAVSGGKDEAQVSTVRIDNRQAARDVADHLIALGHRRFGFIGGRLRHSTSDQRRAGFMDGLEAVGLGAADVVSEMGEFTYESGLEAAERFLSRSPRPTAIFAGNDEMAAAVLAAAQQKGLTCPGDLSIVGFDDTPVARAVFPALTTVHQPIAAMASAAVTILVEEIRARRGAPLPPRHQVQAHRVVARGSSGPAPAR